MKDTADTAIKRIEKYRELPDGWIFHGTDLCVGDVRALAAEVESLREQLINKKRDEIIGIATALHAQKYANNGLIHDANLAVGHAFDLLEAIDEHFERDTDEVT